MTGRVEHVAVVLVVLLRPSDRVSRLLPRHAHLGHLAAGYPALPKSGVVRGRRAATCVLSHLAAAEGVVCGVVEEECVAGGGRW